MDNAGPGSRSLSEYLTEWSWRKELEDEFNKMYFKAMEAKLNYEYVAGTVYPPKHLVFNAFNLTPLHKVKVVIIGQDPYPTFGKVNEILLGQNPYPEFGMAMGLSFSVGEYFKIPRSLTNIFRNLGREIPNFITPSKGNLEAWADRGVLLLNTTLTVKANDANSHFKYDWKIFTDRVIQIINEKCHDVVFLLLGRKAQKKETKIDAEKHFVINAPHPVHYTFNGVRCFEHVNQVLCGSGNGKIDWSLTD